MINIDDLKAAMLEQGEVHRRHPTSRRPLTSRLTCTLPYSSLPLLQDMSMDEVTEMMKKVDKDGDSKIDFEEFKAMMNSMGDEETE